MLFALLSQYQYCVYIAFISLLFVPSNKITLLSGTISLDIYLYKTPHSSRNVDFQPESNGVFIEQNSLRV